MPQKSLLLLEQRNIRNSTTTTATKVMNGTTVTSSSEIQRIKEEEFESSNGNLLKPNKDNNFVAYPGSKSVIGYAISITSCPINKTVVFDGPAILSYSIHHTSIRVNNGSKYDYQLYAFVHPDAMECSLSLELLGYKVLKRGLPFRRIDIQSTKYQKQIEEDGCCGSLEFLKLYAYTLTQHEIVVHTDTDVMFLQPMDTLYDLMLNSNITNNHLMDTNSASQKLLFNQRNKNHKSRSIDFAFTRDYLQGSRFNVQKEPWKFGVQGGFFVVRPNHNIFQEMVSIILQGNYDKANGGWSKLNYGGFWGASQIQGLFSYYYGEINPTVAFELDRCRYNTMVDDPPRYSTKNNNGECRTGTFNCEDCRETPLEQMLSVHLTTCWKPWHCPLIKYPHPERCKDVHHKWFGFRKSLELSWGYQVPTDGWWFKRTLGYCTKKGGAKKRYYLPLQVPNQTSLVLAANSERSYKQPQQQVSTKIFQKDGGFCPVSNCKIGSANKIRNAFLVDRNAIAMINATKRSRWTTIELKNNITYELFLRDPYQDRAVSRVIGMNQEFDAFIKQIILRTLHSPNKVFIDLGANIGYYTSMALALGATTISVEPYFYNAAALMYTIEHNDGWKDRATIYMNAISYESVRVTMESTNTKWNLSNMHIVQTECIHENNITTTQQKQQQQQKYGIDYTDTVSLDQIMLLHHPNIQRVHLLKVDVETYELHALNGAMHFLCHTVVEQILIEIEYLKFSTKCSWSKMMETQLFPMGYDLYDIFEEEQYDHTIKLESIPGRDILLVLRDPQQTPAKRLKKETVNNPCQKYSLQ